MIWEFLDDIWTYYSNKHIIIPLKMSQNMTTSGNISIGNSFNKKFKVEGKKLFNSNVLFKSTDVNERTEFKDKIINKNNTIENQIINVKYLNQSSNKNSHIVSRNTSIETKKRLNTTGYTSKSIEKDKNCYIIFDKPNIKNLKSELAKYEKEKDYIETIYVNETLPDTKFSYNQENSGNIANLLSKSSNSYKKTFPSGTKKNKGIIINYRYK